MTKEQILTIVPARQSTRKFHLVFNEQYLPYKKKICSEIEEIHTTAPRSAK